MNPATLKSFFRRLLFPLFLLLLFIAALALGHCLRTPESHPHEHHHHSCEHPHCCPHNCGEQVQE